MKNKNGNPVPFQFRNWSYTTKLKTKPTRKRIIGSLPWFKTETVSESETDSSPVHSKYINNVLRCKVSHDHTFGVYQNDTDGSFKIGRSSFKFNNKLVFVDGKSTRSVGITNQVQT